MGAIRESSTAQKRRSTGTLLVCILNITFIVIIAQKLKSLKTLKLIAIVSYLLIILMGQMVGVPFFIWLLFTLFDFGNPDQLFAFLAVVGLAITVIIRNERRNFKILFLDIFCLLLLVSPVIRRMTSIPIENFNYLGFIIPALLCVLFYIGSIYFSIKEYLQLQKVSVWRNKVAHYSE